MDIDKLVQLINAELRKDSTTSVNKICNKLQMKQSTVKNQLRKANYTYNAKLREYTKDIQKDNDITKDIIIEHKIDDTQKDKKDIDIDKLRELISLIKPLKAIVKQYNKSNTIVDIENKNELKCKSVTEVKQKLFKVDVNVLEQWEKFVSTHKEYKVQQLISLALEEFIQKYN